MMEKKLKAADRNNMFSRFVAEGRFGQDAADFLIASTDPFHDFRHQIAGYPDGSTSQSATLCVKQQVVITAPASAAGGNWDCHVSANSYWNADGTPIEYTERVYSDATGIWAGVTSGTYSGPGSGLVEINSVPAGQDTFYTAAGTTSTFNGLSPPTTAGRGALRLIGGGFEVTNETAELYINGGVTVYTIGANPMTRKTYGVNAGVYYSDTPACTSNHIGSVAAAYSIPGSVTWEAKLGAYVPFVLDNGPRPFENPNPISVIQMTDFDGMDASNRVRTQRDSYLFNATPSKAVYLSKVAHSGAYFTGLSNNSVLRVTAVFYLEVCPTTVGGSSALIPFLTPAAARSDAALVLYQEVMSAMPPGTQKGNNDAGDWFREISRKAGAAAHTPAAQALMGFLPPGAREAALFGAKMLSKVPAERVFQRKAAPQKPPAKAPAHALTAQAKANLASAKLKTAGK